MFSIIRASNYGAAAYFVTWTVLGKYILLSLFLAVMLDAFENNYQVGHQQRQGGLSCQSSIGTVGVRMLVLLQVELYSRK